MKIHALDQIFVILIKLAQFWIQLRFVQLCADVRRTQSLILVANVFQLNTIKLVADRMMNAQIQINAYVVLVFTLAVLIDAE